MSYSEESCGHAVKIGLMVFLNPLTGMVPELAAAMRGYAQLGVQHIMFQCEPDTLEARQRLTEALQLYRGSRQQ